MTRLEVVKDKKSFSNKMRAGEFTIVLTVSKNRFPLETEEGQITTANP